ERTVAGCVDEEVGPAALEYLVDRVMIALREGTSVPLRAVLEDALRELHPGVPVFLRDGLPPRMGPDAFMSEVPGSGWTLHVDRPATGEPQRALLRAATSFAAVVAELDRRPAPRPNRRSPESELVGVSTAIAGVRERVA